MELNKYKGPNINAIECSAVIAINDDVLVTDMDFGEQTTSSGIVISSDNGKTHGIHPRWAKVYAVGPEQKDVAPGQWVLVEHGRWTRGFTVNIDGDQFTIRKVEVKSMLMVSDEKPTDVLIGQEFGSLSNDVSPDDFIK